MPTERQKKIRNFSIIAHIDHGKSTLADRILEYTRTVATRDMEAQLLDNMDLERERGITIKARAVKLDYHAPDGEQYTLNLIDTPGHVDFGYEVSRSLNACEGALLIVDSTQGVEAQTLANAYLAIDNNLEIVPVINKIDLPSADVEKVRAEIEDIIGIPADGCPAVSAKVGLNIDQVLDKIISDIPCPTGDENAPLRCLIFDSYYDSYLGVVVNIRVVEGTLRAGDRIKLMSTGAEFDIVDVGYLDAFGLKSGEFLSAGDVGYLTASIKSVGDTRVGDTVTLANNPADEPLPGFKEVRPMVFAGIYPADGARYGDLKDALEKLQLNDAALTFEAETSAALGFGFRCGFLGLLHMEIIEERLEREFNLDLITTAPSVIYNIDLKNGEQVRIDNPSNYPPSDTIKTAYEPVVKSSIITPTEFVGGIMDLCQDRRGT
ncbi:MAG: translation elongation factor 4, partial [Clostridia bacterium]|nr:translation elongation factor 4 [Clostridia bacterium]